MHENHDPRLLARASVTQMVLTIYSPFGHLGPPFTRAERGFERWFWRIGPVVVHGRTRAEEHAPWSVAYRSS